MIDDNELKLFYSYLSMVKDVLKQSRDVVHITKKNE